MDIQALATITNSILGGIATLVSPILFKVLVRRDFRDYLKIELKNLLKALMNKTDSTHRLFVNADRYKATALRIEFRNDPLKTRLFHILLTTKIDVVINKINEWISKNSKLLRGYDKKFQLKSSLEALLYDCIDTYEPIIKENYFKYVEDRNRANYYYSISYEGLCADDCEEYIAKKEYCNERCEKVIGFKEYHDANIAHVLRFLDTILECEGESNSFIFSFFLNYIDTALHSAVYDAKKVFEMQNGRYKQNK